MSNPNDEENIPSSSRRSRRSLASNSKQDRQSVLDQLKQARSKGKSYRARVDDLVQDVYMEVDDEEYEAKKHHNREFVEDDDGAGYYDEDSDEEFDDEDKSSKKKKTKRVKEKKGTIKHHFQAITSKQKLQDENSIRIANDDVLKETLAELLGTDNILGEDENATTEFQNAVEESTTIQDQFNRDPSPEIIQEQFTSTVPASSSVQKQFTSARTKAPEIHQEQFIPAVQTPPISPQKQRKRGASPIVSSISTIPSKVARTETEPEEEINGGLLKFYFIDAFEDIYKKPGTVYLFGRIKLLDGRIENCCLTLRNISRQLFFLKRQFSESTSKQVTKEDLSEDVQNTLKTKFGITKFKCKPNLIEKKFISADQTVPRECEALEVWLNCNFGRIPVDLSGDCFSHVMNTTTTALERLLVERNIYGPCWLEIRNAEKSEYPISHCPREFTVNMEEMDNISMASNPPDPPQISIIALNLLTAFNPETKENQIVMASLIHHICHLEKQTKFDHKILKNKRYCVISKFKKGLSLPFDLEDQLNKNGITDMVRRVGDEMALLNIFLTKLEELNPDMILGHDLNAQLILLQSKMEKHKLKKWDRLGRLKRSVQIPKIIGTNSKFVLWELTAGRLCLDSKIAASELIHSRSYEMEDLVVKLLKINNRQNLEIEQISQPFLSTNSKIKLIDLIKWNWNENLYTLKIVENLNAIPLFVQITQIVGGVLSRTLMGGRAERNEYLLLHACFKNNCIPPNKHNAKFVGKSKTNKQESKKGTTKAKNTAMEIDGGGDELEDEEESANLNANGPSTENQKKKKMNGLNKKTQYTGGLVLEPKKGLYDTFIVLLDFNSLYPSIIQEFNICFTTVDNAFADLSEADLPVPPGSSRQDGILKNEIRKLVNRRREVKNLMKQEKVESEKYQQYNIRQMGLKLTANSMYGCLGFQNSRFYAKTLAAMVTSKGRELLMHTKTLVENENFSVIYGDTDSIMVNTNTMDFQQAKLLGQKLKQIVNKNYSLLELDIDGIYKRLLLLKKKKYAALSVDLNDENNATPEMKGLDIVRRDWSELAKDIGEEIVNLILTPSLDRDTLVERIRNRLAERRIDLDEGRFEMEKFEILKQLTRDPADYRDLKSQPHAIIAQRLNESKKFRLRQGDIVKYIICNDGTNNPATQRGYHSSEILANEELSIDKNYYLAQQIHPIVTRLVEPIEELDAYQIAQVLGLDPSSYRRKIAQNIGNIGFTGQNENEQFSLGSNQQDFSACEGITYECPKCQRLNVIRNAATRKDNQFQFGLAQCLECGEDVRTFVKKQLHLIMADQIKKNCQVVYTCDDITCGAESYVVGQFQFSADGIACTKCRTGTLRKNYPDRKLFEQQTFFKFITDLDAFAKQEKALKTNGAEYDFVRKHYKECHSIICNFLDKNAYSKVDLSVVFAPLVISKKNK